MPPTHVGPSLQFPLPADEICAPDCAIHDPRCPEGMFGPELVKALGAMYQQGFPDLEYQVEDTIAEGDKVVTRGSHELKLATSSQGPPAGSDGHLHGH